VDSVKLLLPNRKLVFRGMGMGGGRLEAADSSDMLATQPTKT
jgi:hypothetical protein